MPPRNVTAAPERAEDAPLEDVSRPLTATNSCAALREEEPLEVVAGSGEKPLVDDGQGTKTSVSAPGGSRGHSYSRAPLRGASASKECIDVRTLGRFKVRGTEDRAKGTRIDPWQLEIVCMKGSIYPHGGTRLQAYTDRNLTRKRLKVLPCVTVHQDGDFETTVIFDVLEFARVAEVMKPRKRRPPPAWLPRWPVARRP